MRDVAGVNPPLRLRERTTRAAADRMGELPRLGSGGPHPYAIPVLAEAGCRADPPAPTGRCAFARRPSLLRVACKIFPRRPAC